MGNIISNKYSTGVLENTLIENYQPISFLMTKPYFRKNKGHGKEVLKNAIVISKENGCLGVCILDQSLTGLVKQILDKYIEENRGILQDINSKKYYVFTDENKI